MTVLDQLALLTDERFLHVYESLADHGFGPMDREVAQMLKFRPQAIKKLPLEKRARHARRLLTVSGNADTCYELFGHYLVRQRRDLVTTFLDATGVKHDEGMIEDVDDAVPAADKIADAVEELDGKFDPEDVTLYLAVCAEMWPDSDAILSIWRKRAGAH